MLDEAILLVSSFHFIAHSNRPYPSFRRDRQRYRHRRRRCRLYPSNSLPVLLRRAHYAALEHRTHMALRHRTGNSHGQNDRDNDSSNSGIDTSPAQETCKRSSPEESPAFEYRSRISSVGNSGCSWRRLEHRRSRRKVYWYWK